MKNYSSEGIVLARKNYGEADRILILFTKQFGKVPVIAKGVRKLKSRKRGSIEVFSWIKFSAARTKGLDLVTEVELLDSFADVRENLGKVSLAYYFLEVVGRVSQEREVNEEVFEVLGSHLNELRKSRNLKKLRASFIYSVLTALGFWPRGKVLKNPDGLLEEVLERKINSERVGRKVLAM